MEENPYQSPQKESLDPVARTARPVNGGPSGLKGWLVLVGLGVTLSPIRMLWDFYTVYVPVFTDGQFSDYTDPASPNYTPYFLVTFLLEVLTLAIFFLLTVWVAYLFYTRGRLFPKAYIGMHLSHPVQLIVCEWLKTFPFPGEIVFSDDFIAFLLRACIPIGIWVPYTLLSKRVRNTFVN